MQVDYDGSHIPIPRSKYKKSHKPGLDKLPLEPDYGPPEKIQGKRDKRAALKVLRTLLKKMAFACV